MNLKELAKFSKSQSEWTDWEFKITELKYNSFTVEFKSPWNKRWDSTSSWPTRELAEKALKFYKDNIGRENL